MNYTEVLCHLQISKSLNFKTLSISPVTDRAPTNDFTSNLVLQVESRVREATNDANWGPTGPQMQELAQNSFSYEGK